MPRLTSKGQVTIPIEVREQLGLTAGTLVEIDVRGETAVIRKLPEGRQDRGHRIVAALRGRATVKMSTDEIMRLTRGDD
jgi:AbrB family looped-hinge helix DNA binding protein